MAQYGYTGSILRVNLSTGSVVTEQREEAFYRKYLGGSGFISSILLNELDAGIDPLGPDNKLIFALGPFTGTSVIGNGRNGVGAKSPLTGGIALSQAGGFWGAELKRAGYDALIVEGVAREPVYLWIKDGAVEIRDAALLWGSPTKETQLAIRAELGDEKVQLALIGPGGEKLVPYACIMQGLHNVAGRGGLGAVMGSKNLKAVAVRGTNTPQTADPARLQELNQYFRDNVLYKSWITTELKEYGTLGPAMVGGEKSGDLPVRNFRDGAFPEVTKISGIAIKEKMRIGMSGCYACPVRCKKVVKLETPYTVDPAYGGPEYEALAALGSNLGIDNLEAVVKANEICNAYSVDVISAGGSIAFAMECFEKGLLTSFDTEGIELRFGNAEAMLKCVELICNNEGFGEFLSLGSAKMSRKIGNGSETFAIHVKGLEAGQHEPRLMPSMGLGFMVNPHGADHCLNAHDTAFAARMDRYKSIGFMDTLPIDEISPRKVALFRVEHFRQKLFDCLLLCHFTVSGIDYQLLADLTAAVTGWETSAAELLRIAERVFTTARLFNVREGFTAADDILPKRFFEPKTDGALSATSLDFEQMEQAKKYYYVLMGWDENGVPLPAKVEELGIK